ncbi:MAG: hypothetical protein SFV32_01865 [Opitutaceae bacterium]|nr:hypothetical protein [Opitutaceae bacterium]
MKIGIKQRVAIVLMGESLFVAACVREPNVASVRVVDDVVAAEQRPPDAACVWLPGADRLYRMGDTWVARRESQGAIVRVSPEAQRLLLTTSEKRDPFVHPAPLTQELADELARLKALAAENREAMDRMRQATDTLAETARELLKRNEALAEAYKQARVGRQGPTPKPATIPDEAGPLP